MRNSDQLAAYIISVTDSRRHGTFNRETCTQYVYAYFSQQNKLKM